jgi:hypothetical protein
VNPMTDIATLQAQLAALKAQRASGVRDVQFGERRTVFRDDKDMVAAIASLEAEIAKLSGTPRVRNVVIRGGKGW